MSMSYAGLPAQGLCPRIKEVGQLTRELLAVHGLDDWSFAFNKSKLNMGLCRYGPKSIELSIYFTERNSSATIRDTLLHEIAHALVGPGHGHDAAWKETCMRIGAKPERLSFEADMPVGRWQARCGSCGLMHHRHRKPKWMRGWSCCHCGPERGRLEWTKT
jgi:predicted SprT family Zn-dependent metalloprotease